MLYDLFDKAIVSVLPKVNYYRSFAKIVKKDRIDKVSKGINLSEPAKQYLSKRENDSAFNAYWDVLAQYCLIHADVFGQEINSKNTRGAVAEVGRIFQWVKAADDLVDESPGLRPKNLIALDNLVRGAREPIIPAENFVKETYDSFNNSTKDILARIYEEEMSQHTGDDNEHYLHRGDEGYLFGQLEFKILKEFMPDFPGKTEEFFALSGKAATYFDDFKDFDLDRRNGCGYKNPDMRLVLLSSYLKIACDRFIHLSASEKPKHFAFLVLGGLYQLRELIGIQERT